MTSMPASLHQAPGTAVTNDPIDQSALCSLFEPLPVRGDLKVHLWAEKGSVKRSALPVVMYPSLLQAGDNMGGLSLTAWGSR